MKVDAVVAEIGSTTTVVNAFSGMGGANPVLAGQGHSPTTVYEGDVNPGLRASLEMLKKNMGTDRLEWETFLACSSAAGGLKMTVHGLVYDMTVRAAREAVLGAGAVIHQVTAGKMRSGDIENLLKIEPNIIFLAGGVDYGERETAVYNARLLAELNLSVPVIYGGNIENRDEIKNIFAGTGFALKIVDNVYPRIDVLAVDEARRVIQLAFEENIVNAPGMENIREIVDGDILPSPGAVFLAAELFRKKTCDLAVFDVGGATTDVHSVTTGSEKINSILIHPEPLAKRTVEGDLGVFINRMKVLEYAEGVREVSDELRSTIENLSPIPSSRTEVEAVGFLASVAMETALLRHAGKTWDLYGSGGRRAIARGKDLSCVGILIGTGGALTRLPGGLDLLEQLLRLKRKNQLLPPPEARVYVDSQYIMAAAGMLSRRWPESAVELIGSSLNWKEREE